MSIGNLDGVEADLSDAPPMTMAQALGPIPDFVCEQMGERALLKALENAGLSIDSFNEKVGYVPEIAIDRFLEGAARQSGDSLFGLKVAPLLSVRDYGLWGGYVLAARCLGDSVARAIRTIGIHASGDELFVRAGTTTRKFCYRFAERDGIGYRQVAVVAAGATMSVPQHFLGEAWHPVSVGLDISAGVHRERIEEAFGCPVYFNRDCIEIEIETHHWKRSNPVANQDLTLTAHDVRRAFAGGPPHQFPQVVASLLHQNLGRTTTDLEAVAYTLNVSRRTLQRRLEVDGTSFRNVLGHVKMRRATELLTDSALSIFDVAIFLNYSTTGHFIRAFKAKFGLTPGEYRSHIAIAE